MYLHPSYCLKMSFEDVASSSPATNNIGSSGAICRLIDWGNVPGHGQAVTAQSSVHMRGAGCACDRRRGKQCGVCGSSAVTTKCAAARLGRHAEGWDTASTVHCSTGATIGHGQASTVLCGAISQGCSCSHHWVTGRWRHSPSLFLSSAAGVLVLARGISPPLLCIGKMLATPNTLPQMYLVYHNFHFTARAPEVHLEEEQLGKSSFARGLAGQHYAQLMLSTLPMTY
ncbi:hypothetical protein B0H10DRAFT_1947388 [Mycena sp. CBHHK59/15]|nr:hypothetical protein B0H10DRAFT_1947388 [Mycena sp. CBHHK59/15]